MTTPYPFVAGNILTAQQLNDIQNLPISDKTASYVLTVADAYKRTMMNSGSATTITVNNSIFTVGDVIQVANKGAGVCTVTAGVGVTINTSGSLALAQYGGGYLLCLSASTFTFFNLGGGASYGTATGGTSSSITVGGINYTLLTFTSDGTLTVSKAGLFDVLLLSGAGGAGGGNSAFGGLGSGGGGAGGLLISTVYLDATTYTADVGAGGAGGAADSAVATFGAKSSLGTLLSVAGGGAGQGTTSPNSFTTLGGSNGGCGRQITNRPATTIDENAGKIGGNGATEAGGGGGGYSVAGSNAVTNTGGAGGNGYDRSAFISGAASYVATGGGGGGSTAGGAGGNTSANSNAGKTSGTGNTATANTGSGGGGTCGASAGGAGSSGIIYVRFKS